jgi:hypothetical protein
MFLIFIIQKTYNKKIGVCKQLKGKQQRFMHPIEVEKQHAPLMFLIFIIQKTNKKVNVCQQLEGRQQNLHIQHSRRNNMHC